jgi:hypothetical protein
MAKYMYGSIGYDAGSGFYMENKDFKKLKKDKENFKGKYWIQYPKEISNKLDKLARLEYSFLKRLKFLFKSK